MNLKQLWSIIRGRRTNFSWMNASWTYYPDGDPMSKQPEPTAADYAALADAYEAGLRKMEAVNYEEFDSVIPKHKMIITALRAYANETPVAWITKAGLENWAKGDQPEQHVLLRSGNDLRAPLFARSR